MWIKPVFSCVVKYLYVCFQGAESKSWMTPDALIVGRESSSIALEVAAIYDGGDFMLYEGNSLVISISIFWWLTSLKANLGTVIVLNWFIKS